MSFFSSLGNFASNNSGALLQTGATLGSAGLNYYASQQAADAQSDASDESIALRREIYQQNREDQAPYRAAGYGALDAQASLLGLGEEDANVTNRLRQLPGYQFRMNEGVQARDRSAAARGMTLSGSHQKALTEYGQGLADQTYGQQLNRLASLAGTGQTATNQVGRMGQQFAGGASNAMMQGGNARASSYLTGANQAGNALTRLDYIWGGS